MYIITIRFNVKHGEEKIQKEKRFICGYYILNK